MKEIDDPKGDGVRLLGSSTAPLPKPSRSSPSRFAAVIVALAISFAFTASPAYGAFAHSAAPATFAAPGHGAGQLDLVPEENNNAGSGIAVDQQSGDIYVADTENHRVDEFSASGTFLRSFGADVGGPGVDLCSSSCVAGTSTSEPGGLRRPTFIAVDNSGGPSEGDVYVADGPIAETFDPLSTVSKFDSSGSLVGSWGDDGQLVGLGTVEREHTTRYVPLRGIAVDGAGDLRVLEAPNPSGEGPVRKFDQAGTELGPPVAIPVEGREGGLAVDAAGNLFVGSSSDGHRIEKFDPSTQTLTALANLPQLSGLVVDPSVGDVYALEADGAADHFAPNCVQLCVPLDQFGSGDLAGASGLAVNAVTGVAYVANAGDSDLLAFSAEVAEPAPTASIDPASTVSYSTATATGIVNPGGHASSCRFEYVSEAQFQSEGFLGAALQSCAVEPGSGPTPVPVEAHLSGLAPATIYHARLSAQSPAGLTYSDDATPTFETKAVSHPIVSIEAVLAITATTAHFSGEVDPNAPGPAPQDPAFDAHWHFQCTPACPGLSGGTVAADDAAHRVEGDAAGLSPGTEYALELVAENAGGGQTSAAAGPVTFRTPAVAPSVGRTFVSAVQESEATLNAEIDPGGAATTAHFEYLTEQQFQAGGETFATAESTPETGPIGGDDAAHVVSATVAGLSPATGYVYRVVARNSVGAADSEPGTLFTSTLLTISSACPNEAIRAEDDSSSLPDCRGYEQISTGSEAYGPMQPGLDSGGGGGIRATALPMQSAADGQSVTFIGEPPESGEGGGTGNSGPGEGDQQFAARTPAGWRVTDISPLGVNASTFYEAFNGDLTQGILTTFAGEEPLSPEVETKCNLLYSRASAAGSFSPLFRTETTTCHRPFFVGGATEGSARVFESAAKKTANAQATAGAGHENIYYSDGGQVYLVNVLPGPKPKAQPNATVGSLIGEPGPVGGGNILPAIDTENVVSADGSRVFWTALEGQGEEVKPKAIYVRENPAAEPSALGSHGECIEAEAACTVQVSPGPAVYQSATPDGHYAYYSEAGRLWRFDLAGYQEALRQGKSGPEAEVFARQPLTATGAGVLAVVGVNSTGADGSYLYFVAEADLAPGGETRICHSASPSGSTQEEGEAREEALGEAPAGRGCNLYLLHGDQTIFVAALLPGDNSFQGDALSIASASYGDWRSTIGFRSSRLTPDGSRLVFMSERRLTSYDNAAANECGGPGGGSRHACSEIYLYEAATGRITCSSCMPSGAPPSFGGGIAGNGGIGTYLPADFASITHNKRVISADGDRVFFNTVQPLVGADTNGQQDVYEWERAGTGSCSHGSSANGGGCVYLLSGARQGSGAYLIDADESGANAFFVTRGQLAGGDHDEKVDLYDAREFGGFPLSQESACEGEACKGPAANPPNVPAPGSSSFESSEPPPRCRKGFDRRHGRCVKKQLHKHKKTHRGTNRHKRSHKKRKSTGHDPGGKR